MSNSAKKQDASRVQSVSDVKELILTENDIRSQGIDPSELVILVQGEDATGPLWQTELKEFIALYPEAFSQDDTYVRRLGQEEMTPLFEHPYFQRRRPSVVQEVDTPPIPAETYWVLHKGQEFGPLDLSEVQAGLTSGKFDFETSEVSVDDRMSWHSFDSRTELDRRRESHELPCAPPQDVLARGEELVLKKLSEDTEKKQNLAAIVGLAIVGQQKHDSRKENEKFYQRDHEQDDKSSLYLVVGVVALIVVGLILWGLSGDSGRYDESGETQDAQSSSVRESSPPGHPTTPTFKTGEGKVEDRKFPGTETHFKDKAEAQVSGRSPSDNQQKARPSSFKNSRAFGKHKRRMKDNALLGHPDDPDYRYYNGKAPVQQDPVRSRLSKKTIDPEEEAFPDDPEFDPDRIDSNTQAEFDDEFEGEKLFQE